MVNQQELKRKAVLEEQQKRIQEAMASRPAPQDNLEMKAIKAMGAMEEGDAVFGSGDEVNLDSQVSYLMFFFPPFCLSCYYHVIFFSLEQ